MDHPTHSGNPDPRATPDAAEVRSGQARSGQAPAAEAQGGRERAEERDLALLFLSRLLASTEDNLRARLADLSTEHRMALDALAAIDEAVLVVDAEENIEVLNRAAEEMLGWSQWDARGLPLLDVLRIRDGEIDGAAPLDLAPCLREGLRLSLEGGFVVVGKDGDTIAVEGSASPIFERVEPGAEPITGPVGSTHSPAPGLPGAMARRVVGAVLVLQDVADRRRLTRKLDREARYDNLTGLLNRSGFEEHVAEAFDRAKAKTNPLGDDEDTETLDPESLDAVTDEAEPDAISKNAIPKGPNPKGANLMVDVLCHIDIDLFKVVNETCGHSAGDMLVQWAASLIRERLHNEDVLARTGGDEYGLLIHGTSPEQAESLAAELHQALRNFRFVWQDKSFSIGISIGMVVVSAEFDDLSDLMGAADKACYLAKRKGRGRTQVYRRDGDEMQRHRGQMRWIVKIRQALDEDLFELHWQRILPLAEPAEGRRLFFEVLVRMRDRDGNLCPPGEFLDVAERFGLMQAIDRRVVAGTLRHLSTQSQALLDQLQCVSINLSGASVGDPAMLEFAQRQLDAHPDLAPRICFEITETVAVSNLRSAAEMIHALRDRQCRWALDDFGSGMSSYRYLRELPVDFVKIDGKIVSEILESPLSWTILQSVNEIAHVIDARTIAEQVESAEILAELGKMGVDYGQGFHIHRPAALRDKEHPDAYPELPIRSEDPLRAYDADLVSVRADD